MAEYKNIPEVIYIGMAVPKTGFKKKSLLPEIKIRFNKSRYDLGKVNSSSDIPGVLRKIVGRRIETQEFFIILYFNRSMQVIGFNRHTTGIQHACLIDPKIITATASKLLAAGVIICHNHPSGNLEPSDADKNITAKVKKALDYLEMKLFDHIIITRDGSYSFTDSGILGIGHYPGYRRVSGINSINNDFDNCIG